MKTLSTSELRIQIGKLTAEDCPVIITNHDKPAFILETSKTMDELYKLYDYDPETLNEELGLLKAYIYRKTGVYSENALQDERSARENSSEDDVPQLKPLTPKYDKSKSFEEQMAAFGCMTADQLFSKK